MRIQGSTDAQRCSQAAPDILALDAEDIAARIFKVVPAEKARLIAEALRRRVWQGRPWPD